MQACSCMDTATTAPMLTMYTMYGLPAKPSRLALPGQHKHVQCSSSQQVAPISCACFMCCCCAQGEPRFCTGCRGGHEHTKERSKSWQPYTPLQRFQNLYQLEETPFQVAFRHKTLPAVLNPDSRAQPVRWVMLNEEGQVLRPDRMTDEHYVKFLPLLLHGE